MKFKYSFFLLLLTSSSAFSQYTLPSDGVPFQVDVDGNKFTINRGPAGTAHSSAYFKSPSISNTAPTFSSGVSMPFKHKGGASATATMTWPIDTKKVTSAASKAAGAAAAGAATGNGYLAIASVACAFVCEPLVKALSDWGVDRLDVLPDGSLAVGVPDTASATVSNGLYYYHPAIFNGRLFYSADAACSAYAPAISGGGPYEYSVNSNLCSGRYKFGTSSSWSYFDVRLNTTASDCPSGHFIVSDSCSASAPTVPQPLETYLESNYTGKGWSRTWADITAALVADGVNVFTDGTGTTITGPAVVPVAFAETKTQVNVVPGTTTPVSSGHTGPSDSGTQTVTSTTTAHNTYRPGSANSGPSMTTTQKTTTTTSITNNVTNITNITNTTETEIDEAPEDAVSDTPIPEIPDLYKQKYPNGLSGVVTQKIHELKQTPLFKLPSDLMGNLPSSGDCPSWQLDLNLSSWAPLGVYNVGADCNIWQFASFVVLISALILCRALIFGG